MIKYNDALHLDGIVKSLQVELDDLQVKHSKMQQVYQETRAKLTYTEKLLQSYNKKQQPLSRDMERASDATDNESSNVYITGLCDTGAQTAGKSWSSEKSMEDENSASLGNLDADKTKTDEEVVNIGYRMSVTDSSNGKTYSNLIELISESDLTREQEIRRDLVKQMCILKDRVHRADGKANTLNTKYNRTLDVVNKLRDERQKHNRVLAECKAEAERLRVGSKYELETTRSSYDEQLKRLTEHMVSLKEGIEEKDNLVQHLRSKVASLEVNEL
eukprot:CAMPEP_0204836940 /NCGR_PEP_ID=MMETSP1346-20131115/26656_1 /ASSEMBLY_ACC=CAM_ASM_000771 /TAXON_ID=215587 /ORGANISM="Aplanochytrium stocchinoi, Strain GSBS06" /LENGTH=273 /DNA_ID=CAMNT_0051972081 /DNA_START=169 /DNA_END=990 /DNA_ORIENTATION=+